MTPLSRLDKRTEGDPPDRLGRLADAALEAIAAHPEHRETDQAIIMLDDPADKRGMIAHGGYEQDEDAEAFVNLRGLDDALAQARGVRLDFIPMADPPGEG